MDGKGVSQFQRNLTVRTDDYFLNAFVFDLFPFRFGNGEVVVEAVGSDRDLSFFEFGYGAEIAVDESAFQILGNHDAGPDFQLEIDGSDAVLRIELASDGSEVFEFLFLVLGEFGIVMRVDHIVEREQVDRFRIALTLLEFGQRRDFSVADLIEKFHELGIFRTFHFEKFDLFEIVVGFRFVELERPVLCGEFLDGDLVGIRNLRIYGRKLFRISDEYDLQSSERTEIVPFVLQDEIDLVQEIRSYH